jgi:hypothetical protein
MIRESDGALVLAQQSREVAMAEQRKLAAILAGDVVGYSRFAKADEDRTGPAQALRSDRCAIEMQTAMVERNAGLAPSVALSLCPDWDIAADMSLHHRTITGLDYVAHNPASYPISATVPVLSSHTPGGAVCVSAG